MTNVDILDILIPIVFIVAISALIKYHKRQKEEREDQPVFETQTDAANSSNFRLMYNTITDLFNQNGRADLVHEISTINFYLVDEMRLRGVKIFGLAFSGSREVFLDRILIDSGSPGLDQYGTMLHEIGHVHYKHRGGLPENEAEAGQFAGYWVKKLGYNV